MDLKKHVGNCTSDLIFLLLVKATPEVNMIIVCTFDSSNGSFIYLILYVDYMLIASKGIFLINNLKSQLSNEFEMKNLGATKKILGMEIHRERQAGKLYLSKKKNTEKILEKFNMSKS